MKRKPSFPQERNRLTDVIDEGSLHKYRTEIPNTVIRGLKSQGLSVYAKWLYVYLKSVTGDGGQCYRSTTTIAAESGISRGQVSVARQELMAHGLITITKGKNPRRDTDTVRINDIWHSNMQEFCVHNTNTDGDTQDLKKQKDSSGSVHNTNTDDFSVHNTNTRQVVDKQGDSEISVHNTNTEPASVHNTNTSVHNTNAPYLLIRSHEEEEKDLRKDKEKTLGFSDENPSAFPQQAKQAYSAGFLTFWQAYPVKKQKDTAWNVWKKKHCEAEADQIVASIALHQQHDTQWRAGYIPYPTTFLNGGGWKDEFNAPIRRQRKVVL